MTCLIKSKENDELIDRYAKVLGSREAAYYALTENNGYTLDLTPQGNRSLLYQQLQDRYGDKADLYKTMTLTSKFYDMFGKWTEGQYKDDPDSNYSFFQDMSTTDINTDLEPTIKAFQMYNKETDNLNMREVQMVKDFEITDNDLLRYLITNDPVAKQYYYSLVVSPINSDSHREAIRKIYQQMHTAMSKERWESKNREEYNQNCAKKIAILLSNTRQLLIKSFGLKTAIDDRTGLPYLYKEGKNGNADLVIMFVNSIAEGARGQIMHFDNPESIRTLRGASTVIKLGLDKMDATTFDHELCHYYVRAFWNSDVIHNAIEKVRKESGKKMTDAEAEEKLVSMMTDEKYHDYLTNSDNTMVNNVINKANRSLSNKIYQFVDEVWKGLTNIIQNMFDSMSKNDKTNAYLLATTAFILNQQLEINNNLPAFDYTTNYVAYQKETYSRGDISTAKDTFRKLSKELQHRKDKNQQLITKLDNFTAKLNEKTDAEAAYEIVEFVGKEMDGIKQFLASQTSLDVSEDQRFSKATPDNVVYFKRDFIDAYSSLINELHGYAKEVNDAALDDRIKQLGKDMSEIKIGFEDMLEYCTTKLVSDYVDEHVTLGDIDSFRSVALDWLLRQKMYGDIGAVERYAGLFQKSQNPILRMAYNMISNANNVVNTQTLSKGRQLVLAFNKAFNAVERSLPSNKQAIFLERDRHGKFTGYFNSKIKYGEYQNDKEEFIKKLNKRYVKHYGATINDDDSISFPDDDNEYVYTSTSSEYEMPIRNKYQLEIEGWKCEHANRRYTYRYYEERLSKPYRETIDDTGKIVNNGGHGLSKRTMDIEQSIRDQITNLEKLCNQDGYIASWKLTQSQQKQLTQLRAQLKGLGRIFNQDGSKKTGEELETAQEITAWNAYISNKIDYSVDQDKYEEDLQKVKDAYGENSAQVNQFVHDNSINTVNPKYYDAVAEICGSILSNAPHETSEQETKLILAKKTLQQLKDIAKLSDEYDLINLTQYEDNMDFWNNVIEAQAAIDSYDNIAGTKYGKQFFDYFTTFDVPHFDENGQVQFLLDDNGNVIRNQYGKPLYVTEFDALGQHIVYKYTNIPWYMEEAKAAYIEFLRRNSSSNANIDPNSTPSEEWIKQHYFYSRFQHEKNGKVDKLPIFSFIKPSKKSISHKGTVIQSQIRQAKGKYSRPAGGEFITGNEYDYNIGGEQPKVELYDNSKEFNKMHDKYGDLFDLFINTMNDAYDMLPDYQKESIPGVMKVPQIYADTISALSRTSTLSSLFSSIKYFFWDKPIAKNNNDVDFMPGDEQETRPDGSPIYTVPVRFIQKLKHTEKVSSDLVSTVTTFYNMAVNYREMSKLENPLLSLQYELQSRNDTANSSKRSAEMLSDLIGGNIYGDTTTGLNWKIKNRKINATGVAKLIKKAKQYSAWRMLAWNTASAAVGALSSTSMILRDVFTGKYITAKDLVYAHGYFFKYAFPMMFNMGSKLSNNKMTCMMQMNQMTKSNEEIFKNSRSKLMRFVGEHLFMGGYTLGDYCNNAMALGAIYHHERFYEGDAIEKGFYTKSQMIEKLMNTGLTRKQAKSIYHNCGTTLFDVYKYKNGNVTIDPDYKKYVNDKLATDVGNKLRAKTQTYNGMMSKQETSYIERNIFGQFIMSMRRFAILFTYEAWSGGNDYIPMSFEDGKTNKNARVKVKPKDADMRRGYYNFETQEIERGTNRQAFEAIYKSVRNMWGTLRNRCVRDEFKKEYSSLTQNEKYAFRSTIFTIASIVVAAELANLFFMAKSNVPDPPRDESFWDMGWSGKMQYMKALALTQLELWFIREVNESMALTDPRTILDFISSVTTFMSTSNNFETALGDLLLRTIGTANADVIVNNGPYKGWNKIARDINKLTPYDNMYTNSTIPGVKGKIKFYYNLNRIFLQLVGMKNANAVVSSNSDDDNNSYGQSDFGSNDFGSNDFGQNDFGESQFN